MVWVEGEVLPQITVIYLTTRKQSSVDQKMKRHTICHVRTTIPVRGLASGKWITGVP